MKHLGKNSFCFIHDSSTRAQVEADCSSIFYVKRPLAGHKYHAMVFSLSPALHMTLWVDKKLHDGSSFKKTRENTDQNHLKSTKRQKVGHTRTLMLRLGYHSMAVNVILAWGSITSPPPSPPS